MNTTKESVIASQKLEGLIQLFIFCKCLEKDTHSENRTQYR